MTYDRSFEGGSFGKSYSFSKRIIRALIVVTKDGKELNTYQVADTDLAEAIDNVVGLDLYEGTVEEDDKQKMPDGVDSIPLLMIDVSKIPTFTSKQRSVACCAYSATSDAMKHLFGCQLDNDDRNWYTQNSLVNEHGLPQANSFTVIHQLVEPYGLGVNRIAIPRNSCRFPEFKPFLISLGCNPFFAQDGNTTNQEALEKMFPDPEIRKKSAASLLSMWRFECTDAPLNGSITMRQFNENSSGHNGGSTYRGLRSKTSSDGWRMSVSLARLENIKYVKPLDIPEYQEYEGHKEFSFSSIKDARGKTLKEIGAELREERFQRNKKAFESHSGKSWNAKDKAWDSKDKAWESNVKDFRKDKVQSPMVLAYPPTCPTCHKDYGTSYSDKKRNCQWCGTLVPASQVVPSQLADGWRIALDIVPPSHDDVDKGKEDEQPSWWNDYCTD